MLKIDSHQHFWKYDPVRDSWITDEMSVLKRDYLPRELELILKASGIDGCITVQSDQSEAENDYQLANAERYSFIKGIVGWVDLMSANVEERLVHYSHYKKLKGFRHILQGEPQRDLMLRPDFLKGISLLNRYDLTYEILIYPDQLPFVKELVAMFPEQRFVIDHIAKPNIKENDRKKWSAGLSAIAEHQNVYCKISGMVTEADWGKWKMDDLTPFIDTVVQAFTTDRVMFGSDWPVCLVAATYGEVINIVANYFSTYSDTEQEKVFGGNAVKFYKL